MLMAMAFAILLDVSYLSYFPILYKNTINNY